MGKKAGLVAVAVVLAIGGWYLLVRSDTPEQVSLEGAISEAIQTTTRESTNEDPFPAPADITLDGTWSLADDGLSFVGYRVGEELAKIGITEAVGRTDAVTGTLELEGAMILDLSVVADLQELRSDADRRDNALRTQALETDTFPQASFVLTEPIVLEDVPTDGTALSAVARGELNLHGTTQAIEFPVEAQLSGDTVVVVGALRIAYGEWGIAFPSAPVLLSVDDTGTIELQLAFHRP